MFLFNVRFVSFDSIILQYSSLENILVNALLKLAY